MGTLKIPPVRFVMLCVAAFLGAGPLGASGQAIIQFTERPSYVPSPDGASLAIVARNIASNCDTTSSACGGGYFNFPSVQLWALSSPFGLPLPSPGGIPPGSYPLATTSFSSYDASTGLGNANSSFSPYAPPPPGTYYLAMIILGSQGPTSAVNVYGVWNFPGPVHLDAAAPLSAVVDVVEYYDAALDHYFMTPLPQEIALCDAGQAPCTGWKATGHTFDAYPVGGEPDGSVAVCRFYNDSYAQTSSHFYANVGGACEATLQQFPDWRLETSDLFGTDVPDADGGCGDGFAPVYRLFNDGMGGAPNHRFTTDLAVRARMISAGWIPEGAGIGVVMCAPQ